MTTAMSTARHLAATAALLLAATALADAKPKPVKDAELGLSKVSVFTVPSPPAYHDEATMPGEKPLPRRISSEVPPVIPHATGDFLPITRTANACVDCHAIAGPKKKGEPTPLPASHYVDLRNAPKVKGSAVAGARWVCTACHVGRTDAAPLVKSGFRP